MRLSTRNEIELFMDTVKKCKEPVWLTNNCNEKYNLKSTLSLFRGIAGLISENCDDYELYCDSKEDEGKFMHLFMENPQILNEPA